MIIQQVVERVLRPKEFDPNPSDHPVLSTMIYPNGYTHASNQRKLFILYVN